LTSTVEPTTSARDPLLTISNRMVRLYKDAFGRGPRRARASYAGPDSLLVVLERTLTTAELTLAALGEPRQLHEGRLIIQSALEPRARGIVEEVLHRRTVAFATGLDPRHDIAALFFTLTPRAESQDADFERREPNTRSWPDG
jgi:uncharacterized protein YbcI